MVQIMGHFKRCFRSEAAPFVTGVRISSLKQVRCLDFALQQICHLPRTGLIYIHSGMVFNKKQFLGVLMVKKCIELKIVYIDIIFSCWQKQKRYLHLLYFGVNIKLQPCNLHLQVSPNLQLENSCIKWQFAKSSLCNLKYIKHGCLILFFTKYF